MQTFGIYNPETKELFKFNTYIEAFRAYTMLLDDLVEEDYRIPDQWYLVFIRDNKIVQLEQFLWKINCKTIEI